MSNLGAFAWTLFFCAILAHAGVKTEVFYSIYWLHIHRDKVSMHLHSEMEMERGRKDGGMERVRRNLEKRKWAFCILHTRKCPWEGATRLQGGRRREKVMVEPTTIPVVVPAPQFECQGRI